jgi:predicted transcriptional regulator of viral defense system
MQMHAAALTSRLAIARLSKSASGGLIRVSEAAVALGVSNQAAATRLASLVRNGWAQRVRRGLYMMLSAEIEPNEPVKSEDPWLLAREVFAPCYIGGWSAGAHWGLTEQLFMSTLVVTAANLRTNSAVLAGQSFRLFKVAKERTQHAVPVLRDGFTVMISSRERTLVDCFRHPELCGGIRHLASMMRAYAKLPEYDFRKLIDEGSRGANGAAWKRLGYLGELIWPAIPEIQEIAKQNLSAGYSRLDPWNKERGKLVRRWRLWINAVISEQSDRPDK